MAATGIFSRLLPHLEKATNWSPLSSKEGNQAFFNLKKVNGGKLLYEWGDQQTLLVIDGGDLFYK